MLVIGGPSWGVGEAAGFPAEASSRVEPNALDAVTTNASTQ
jgi:hypothetical protein